LSSSQTGPISMPPITLASGRCTWLPMPVEIAAANKPIAAETAIIRIGRICSPAARNIFRASAGPPPVRYLSARRVPNQQAAYSPAKSPILSRVGQRHAAGSQP